MAASYNTLLAGYLTMHSGVVFFAGVCLHVCTCTYVWYSGNALVSINRVILRRTRLVLGWVTFASSNRVRNFSVFKQPPRPTQPGHPSRVGKMSTGVKTGKVTAGYGIGVVYCQ